MTLKKDTIKYFPLTSEYFSQVISLTNSVHGDGYLDNEKIVEWTNKGIVNMINCSFVALLND